MHAPLIFRLANGSNDQSFLFPAASKIEDCDKQASRGDRGQLFAGRSNNQFIIDNQSRSLMEVGDARCASEKSRAASINSAGPRQARVLTTTGLITSF